MRVHYDYRCNRLVVCDVLELLGLTLSPVQNLETTTLTWNQMKLQPYFENKISVSKFINVNNKSCKLIFVELNIQRS